MMLATFPNATAFCPTVSQTRSLIFKFLCFMLTLSCHGPLVRICLIQLGGCHMSWISENLLSCASTLSPGALRKGSCPAFRNTFGLGWLYMGWLRSFVVSLQFISANLLCQNSNVGVATALATHLSGTITEGTFCLSSILCIIQRQKGGKKKLAGYVIEVQTGNLSARTCSGLRGL